ncbi:MAG: J domain-containing protein [Acidobacteria bacterium]|nr:J domain-containing protein [Acidobacteriota bacterium]
MGHLFERILTPVVRSAIAMATGTVIVEGTRAEVCQRKVVSTAHADEKVECIFGDGSSIRLSSFLASFISAGDEVRFPLVFESADAGTEIHIGNARSQQGRRDIYQASIGYAAHPKKDKRGNLFVSAQVLSQHLGISAIHIRCETLRDYFYTGNRRRAWNRQPTFYELLRVSPNASPAEIRVAFKLRTLELRAARASPKDLSTLERAFNILAQPELRSCYDALSGDPESLTLFPHGGFGSLLVAGNLSRDGATFYATRILSFLPERRHRYLRVPLRKLTFYSDHAIYRDTRRHLEVVFDSALLPLTWDATWNQWKHLLGAKVAVRCTFIQSGKYRRRRDEWELVQWETALPSRIEVKLPADIANQIGKARNDHHRFGQFADALECLRTRIEAGPVESATLKKMCGDLGIPGDFDVAQITWKPDYDAFFYRQLCRRARRLYLFRSEYIFDLENVTVVETPQLGHATYLFTKPANMGQFLAVYSSVTKEDIRQNRENVAERLGFLGRLIHGVNPRAWLKELKERLGEVVDYAEAEK